MRVGNPFEINLFIEGAAALESAAKEAKSSAKFAFATEHIPGNGMATTPQGRGRGLA